MAPRDYFRLIPELLFGTERTKEILNVNPTLEHERLPVSHILISVFNYDEESVHEERFEQVEDVFYCRDEERISWINIDGIRKSDVEKVCTHFGIHPLLAEDILSCNQRPKMDEVEGVLYCLLNMLYFNQAESTVEQEQVSIALGRQFVITFQEDPTRDVFNPVRERLRLANSKVRQRPTDYLCYTLIDLIVDNYFLVMEQLGERIEDLEEEVVRNATPVAMASITRLRKELIVLKRNILPVRDMVSAIIRSESPLLDERTMKYFKDVYDHITQAADLSENYRDVMMSMQDLYINNVNLKMNEAMKVMAIVTCLLAPATVIGGIFGMNFERVPLLHDKWGFFISVGLMLLIPLWMIRVFRRRGWF
ncbi:MAG: magnesium/cobalt transporter CorA [Verrucomicrobiaceae bacterium]|nr:MAG: magnesium/cobalt transporter CorA [Verrucomicrobiaceae bacterium]